MALPANGRILLRFVRPGVPTAGHDPFLCLRHVPERVREHSQGCLAEILPDRWSLPVSTATVSTTVDPKAAKSVN
jgi:hypothetical protein